MTSDPIHRSGDPSSSGAGPAVRRGNSRCLVCRYLRVLPFNRCRSCTLSRMAQCPTIKAGLLLTGATAAAGVAAYMMGGPASRTALIMTGLISVILLLMINSHSNRQARTRAQLIQYQQELARQHEFLRKLSPLEGLSECLDYVVESTAEQLRCRRVSIMLADEKGEHLVIAASRGLPEEVVAGTRIRIGQGVSGRVFQNDKPIHVHDARSRRGSEALPIDSAAFMSGPLMLSGMRWGNARLGVLSITEPIGRDDFSVEDEFVFSNICAASAVAVYNHMAVAQAKQANVEFLETLVNAIEARDAYTRGHSERVSAYAEAMGRRLGMDEESVSHLRTAGRLHDIGKIGFSDAILRKSSALTEAEWDLVHRHTDVAAEMLGQASMVSAAIDAISRHHERLDGSGYPHGLAGEQIPLMARILGVADAFDAMTTERPYSQPISVADALAELRRDGGRQFDIACVNVLVEAVRSGRLDEILLGGTAPRADAVAESAG